MVRQTLAVSAKNGIDIEFEVRKTLEEGLAAALTLTDGPDAGDIRGYAELTRENIAEIVAIGQAILDQGDDDGTTHVLEVVR